MALRTQIFTMVPLIATPHFDCEATLSKREPLGRRNSRNGRNIISLIPWFLRIKVPAARFIGLRNWGT
jgi:hypothetical protein